jgi:hypothetical protein
MIIRDYHFNKTIQKICPQNSKISPITYRLTLLFYLHDVHLRELPAAEPEEDDSEEDLDDESRTEREDEREEFGKEDDEEEKEDEGAGPEHTELQEK